MSVPSADRRAFTLAEILVAAAVTVLFFGLVFAVLIPGARSYVRGAVRANLGQQAALALRSLNQDLEASAPALVGLLEQPEDRFPVVLSLTRLAGVEPDGDRLWEDRAVLYVWDREEGRLWRCEVPGTELGLDPGRPRPLAPAEMADLARGAGGDRRSLARDVDRFEAASAGGLLTVRLRLKRSEAHQTEPEVVELARKIEPLHSL